MSSVKPEASVLILRMERIRSLKAESQRRAAVWGVLGALVTGALLFLMGVPGRFDPGGMQLLVFFFAAVFSFRKSVRHLARYRSAARELPAYEAAFEKEFSPAIGVGLSGKRGVEQAHRADAHEVEST